MCYLMLASVLQDVGVLGFGWDDGFSGLGTVHSLQRSEIIIYTVNIESV